MNKYTEIMDHVVLTADMQQTALENIRKKQSSPQKRQWSWEKSLVLAASLVIVLTAAIIFPNLNRGPSVEGPDQTFGVTQSETRSGGSVNKTRAQIGATSGADSQTPEKVQSIAQQTSKPQQSVLLGNGSTQDVDREANSGVQQESVQAIGPQEVGSKSGLERSIGHKMKSPLRLPFSANQFLYTDYGDGMGGVTATQGEQEVETRMAKLTDTADPSGDYTVYNTTKTKSINGHTVTLKGNDGKYQLAVWNDGMYSYSVRSEQPLTEDELTAIVGSVK